MSAGASSGERPHLVLSIDLDFFVSPIAHYVGDVERLPKDAYVVDDASIVRGFLENQCRLQKSRPIPGLVVTHNHEAFFVLREEIAARRLIPPFELVHVDAHSDLGMGDPGYVFILTKLLNRPVNQRAYGFPEANAISFGNWIAFVIANRWITSMTFVTHPDYSSDLPWMYFKDIDVESGAIQMRPRSKVEIDTYLTSGERGIFAGGRTREPLVRFTTEPRASFRLPHAPDLIVLSQSPGYTPRTADSLLDLISTYISPQVGSK